MNSVVHVGDVISRAVFNLNSSARNTQELLTTTVDLMNIPLEIINNLSKGSPRHVNASLTIRGLNTKFNSNLSVYVCILVVF